MSSKGLEGVVAANSAICTVDGEKGRLIYRGYDIHDLAINSTFEEVVYLLWFGSLPTRSQLDDLSKEIANNRALPDDALKWMKDFPKTATPMDVLRTTVSALSMYDPDGQDNSRETNLRKAIRLVAQVATIVAAYDRIRNGKEPIAPDASLGQAGNFVYMLTGNRPDQIKTRAFDIALILHAEHELNASTFAARVTAATLSDIYSAIVSAIGALKGPLHGGANEAVMNMLLKIEEPDQVEEYIKNLLAQKKKVMGFGHRVYRTEDPRATHLRRMSQELGQSTGEPRWFEMSRRIEEFMKKEKGLNANVDFYSATVYYYLGVVPDLFTPIFAVSRMAGWTAHVLEQYADNRLIRPRAEYIGPIDRRYIPIQERAA